ncbi:MAG TPA: PAS domain-containing protein [Verrucomicrobiae bacterium]|jgi:PAS domain S-box-containing protein|nr:PAS domain-containing protein [Verrucomicrobiae bacterium]
MNSANPTALKPKPEVEFFQQLADGAPVMIWMSGSDMGCFYFNRAWFDYRGRTAQQESGNGWAEGVHPDDLERCVQHYVGSFQQRVSFAMSYRLQDRHGEYRWILDRGVPHYDAEGGFLGFYGGCAETTAEVAVSRIKELRLTLQQMKDRAEHLPGEEAENLPHHSRDPETLETRTRQLMLEHRAREHAAAELGKLAADMLVYDRIEKGACLE